MKIERRLTLREAMEKAPQLTDFGFGLHHEHRQKTPQEWQEKFTREREALAQSNKSFRATCAWIAANLEKRKTIGYDWSSYGLKHIAEKEIGYITNGVFIAAMIALGYDWAVDGPNAYFNVGKHSINRARDRVEQQRLRKGFESTHVSKHSCARADNCTVSDFASYSTKGIRS